MINRRAVPAGIPMLPRFSTLLLATTISSFFLASCDSKTETPPVILPTVQLKTNTNLGIYLADSLGNTLYSFANDFNGQNNCAGGCTPLWPVYYAGDHLPTALLASGLNPADFGSITLTGGTKQTTYKTWPLYYYAPLAGAVNTREAAGEIRGEGVGTVWHVAKPDYSIRLINAQLTGLDGKNYKSDYTEGTGKTLYFTDASGATLYHFSKDSADKNKFTKADLSNNTVWPMYENDKVVVPSTLDKALFGSITVFGKKQLTYKGWPLYYFGADNKQRGINKGVSVGGPGTWPVMVKEAAAAPVQ